LINSISQAFFSNIIGKKEKITKIIFLIIYEFKNNNIFHYIIFKNLVKNNGGRAEI